MNFSGIAVESFVGSVVKTGVGRDCFGVRWSASVLCYASTRVRLPPPTIGDSLSNHNGNWSETKEVVDYNEMKMNVKEIKNGCIGASICLSSF